MKEEVENYKRQRNLNRYNPFEHTPTENYIYYRELAKKNVEEEREYKENIEKAADDILNEINKMLPKQ